MFGTFLNKQIVETFKNIINLLTVVISDKNLKNKTWIPFSKIALIKTNLM